MNCLCIGILSILIFSIIIIIMKFFKKSHFTDDNLAELKNLKKNAEEAFKKASDTLAKAEASAKKKHPKIDFNEKKCLGCMKKWNKLNEMGLCPTCASQNFDSVCKPIGNEVSSLHYIDNPTNCLSSEFSPSDAFWFCKSVGNSENPCTAVNNDNLQSYQKKYVKNYCVEGSKYCAFDDLNSCSNRLCELSDARDKDTELDAIQEAGGAIVCVNLFHMNLGYQKV